MWSILAHRECFQFSDILQSPVRRHPNGPQRAIAKGRDSTENYYEVSRFDRFKARAGYRVIVRHLRERFHWDAELHAEADRAQDDDLGEKFEVGEGKSSEVELNELASNWVLWMCHDSAENLHESLAEQHHLRFQVPRKASHVQCLGQILLNADVN